MKMTLIDKDLLRTTIVSNTDATEQDAAQIINAVLMKQRKRDTGQREHDRHPLVELLRLGPYARDDAETRATMEQAADQIERMRVTLQGIAEANWRTWDELASPHEFVSWAQNLARHALSPVDKEAAR